MPARRLRWCYKDEVGNVETLKFLYVTDGSLGEVDASTTYVRVLGKVGAVYENNTAYTCLQRVQP